MLVNSIARDAAGAAGSWARFSSTQSASRSSDTTLAGRPRASALSCSTTGQRGHQRLQGCGGLRVERQVRFGVGDRSTGTTAALAASSMVSSTRWRAANSRCPSVACGERAARSMTSRCILRAVLSTIATSGAPLALRAALAASVSSFRRSLSTLLTRRVKFPAAGYRRSSEGRGSLR
jgi:hypothetical protein